ncbi:MAG: sigma-70 family RNA polymerase sigma factor [Pseudomonadota bacterium]
MSDDREIVQQVLADRPGAFEQLVARHERLVWHIARRMCRREDDARDVTQEAFLRVYRKLAQFRFDSSLATWIGRVTYNLAVRSLEKKRPETGIEDAPELPSSDPGPDRQIEAHEAKARVSAALEALDPVPRTIVSLHHLQHLSVQEIAAVTDLPAGTVKSHLFRARRRMRAMLEEIG